MGTLRFFEEVVSFKIRRTFGFADYTTSDGKVVTNTLFLSMASDSVVENRTAAFPEEGRRSHRNG